MIRLTNEILRFSLAGLGLATAGSLYDNSRFQYNGRLNRYSRQQGYRRYDYEVSSDWLIYGLLIGRLQNVRRFIRYFSHQTHILPTQTIA